MSSFYFDEKAREYLKAELAKHNLPKPDYVEDTTQMIANAEARGRKEMLPWVYYASGMSFIAGLTVSCLVARIAGVM